MIYKAYSELDMMSNVRVSFDVKGILGERDIKLGSFLLTAYTSNSENECSVYAVIGQNVYWSYTWLTSNIGRILKTDLVTGETTTLKVGDKLASWQGVKVGDDIYTVGQEHTSPMMATVQKISGDIVTEEHHPDTDDVNELIGVDVDETYIYAGERGWITGVGVDSNWPNGGGFWKIPLSTWDDYTTWVRTWENPHKFEIVNILKKFNKIFLYCADYTSGYWEILSSPVDDLVTWTHEHDYSTVSLGSRKMGCIFDIPDKVASLAPISGTLHLLTYDGTSWTDKDLDISISNFIWFKGIYDPRSDVIICTVSNASGHKIYTISTDGETVLEFTTTSSIDVGSFNHFQSRFGEFNNNLFGLPLPYALYSYSYGELVPHIYCGSFRRVKPLSVTPEAGGTYISQYTVLFEEGSMNEDFSDILFVTEDYSEVIPFNIESKEDGVSCTFNLYLNPPSTDKYNFRVISKNSLIDTPFIYPTFEVSNSFLDEMNNGSNWDWLGTYKSAVTYSGGIATIPVMTYLQQNTQLKSIPLEINARIKFSGNNTTVYWVGLCFGSTMDQSLKVNNYSSICEFSYWDGSQNHSVSIPNIADGNFHDINIVVESTGATLKIDADPTEYTITYPMNMDMHYVLLVNHPAAPSNKQLSVDYVEVTDSTPVTPPTVEEEGDWEDQYSFDGNNQCKINLVGDIASTLFNDYFSANESDIKDVITSLKSPSGGTVEVSNQNRNTYTLTNNGGSIRKTGNLLQLNCESAEDPVWKDFIVMLPAHRTMRWQALANKSFTGGEVKMELIDPTADPLIDTSAAPLASYSLPDQAETNLPLKLGFKSDKAMMAILRISAKNASGTVEVDTRLIENRVQHGS